MDYTTSQTRLDPNLCASQIVMPKQWGPTDAAVQAMRVQVGLFASTASVFLHAVRERGILGQGHATAMDLRRYLAGSVLLKLMPLPEQNADRSIAMRPGLVLAADYVCRLVELQQFPLEATVNVEEPLVALEVCAPITNAFLAVLSVPRLQIQQVTRQQSRLQQEKAATVRVLLSPVSACHALNPSHAEMQLAQAPQTARVPMQVSRTVEATSTCSCHGVAVSNGFVCPADGGVLAPKCGALTCKGPFFSGCKCFASGQFCVDGGADLNGVCVNRCSEGAIVAGNTCRCGLSPCPVGSQCAGGKCLAKCEVNAFNRATTSCHCADSVVPPGQYCDPSDSVVTSKKECGLPYCENSQSCACPDSSNTCASISLTSTVNSGKAPIGSYCPATGDAVAACGAPSCSTITDKSKCACSLNGGTCFPSTSGSKQDAGECLSVCEPNLETKHRCVCNGIPVLANYFCPAAPASSRSKRGVLDAIAVCQTPTCPSNALSSCTCETIAPGNVCVASRTGRNGQCLQPCSVASVYSVELLHLYAERSRVQPMQWGTAFARAMIQRVYNRAIET
ncbi:hypothetical protein BJ741DRAFT_667321 [Chytriomyces cf. hyalinus JEL632]|nr:hypothetical protein BJ741DRAFT_667321 [Chytriomyces cf. hyalinus JEL632]